MYHSTETALLKITNYILMHQNEQCSITLVAIDLSAAFDLVNHSIILERLDTYYGICGTALEWFRSYLSVCRHRVVINGVYSKEKMLDHGVPQGSVLGAKLYTLYNYTNTISHTRGFSLIPTLMILSYMRNLIVKALPHANSSQ